MCARTHFFRKSVSKSKGGGATNSFPSELLRTLECNIPKCDQVPGRVSVSCLHTPHRNSPMKTCQSSWYKAYFRLEHSPCYNFILNLVWIENVQLSFATSFCSKNGNRIWKYKTLVKKRWYLYCEGTLWSRQNLEFRIYWSIKSRPMKDMTHNIHDSWETVQLV